MSGIKVYNYRDIDFNTINFEKPKKVKGGGYMSLISYASNKNRLVIQSPKLQTSSGIQSNNIRSYIELLLDKGHWPFYQFINELDSNIISVVNNNSLDWFGQPFPIDVLEELFQSNIKMSGKKSIPKVKFKIQKSKGDLNCNIYNNKNELQLENYVQGGNRVVCILELLGIKFLKQQLYLEWKVLQIKVYDNNKDNIDNCIIDNNLISDNENLSDNELGNLKNQESGDELIFEDIDTQINSELKLFEKDNFNKSDIISMNNIIDQKVNNMHNQDNMYNQDNIHNQDNMDNQYKLHKENNLPVKIDVIEKPKETKISQNSEIVKTENLKDLENNIQKEENDLEELSDYSSDVEEFIESLDDLVDLHQVNLDKKEMSKNEIDNLKELSKNDLIELITNTNKEINKLKKISDDRETEINTIRNKYSNLLN